MSLPGKREVRYQKEFSRRQGSRILKRKGGYGCEVSGRFHPMGKYSQDGF